MDLTLPPLSSWLCLLQPSSSSIHPGQECSVCNVKGKILATAEIVLPFFFFFLLLGLAVLEEQHLCITGAPFIGR